MLTQNPKALTQEYRYNAPSLGPSRDNSIEQRVSDDDSDNVVNEELELKVDHKIPIAKKRELPVEIKQITDDNKDFNGATISLRQAINRQYTVVEILGRGSFGLISRAKSKETGQEVALKVMTYSKQTDYDCTSILREISLMRRVNNLTAHLDTEKRKNLFVPELIDIILPFNTMQALTGKNGKHNIEMMELDEICLVIELMESDLD